MLRGRVGTVANWHAILLGLSYMHEIFCHF